MLLYNRLARTKPMPFKKLYDFKAEQQMLGMAPLTYDRGDQLGQRSEIGGGYDLSQVEIEEERDETPTETTPGHEPTTGGGDRGTTMGGSPGGVSGGTPRMGLGSGRLSPELLKKGLATMVVFKAMQEHQLLMNGGDAEGKAASAPEGPAPKEAHETARALFAGLMTVDTVTGVEGNYKVTGSVSFLGDFSGAPAVAHLAGVGEAMTASMKASAVGKSLFESATLKAACGSDGTWHANIQGSVRDHGRVKGWKTTLTASGTDVTALRFKDESEVATTLVTPNGFQAGEVKLANVDYDVAGGKIAAASGSVLLTSDWFGTVTSESFGIADGNCYGDFTVTSPTFELPAGGTPVLSGNVEGQLKLSNGEWSMSSVGGDATARIPGVVDPIVVRWTMPIAEDQLGNLTAVLKQPARITDHLTVTSTNIAWDHGTKTLSLDGAADVSGIARIKDGKAAFKAQLKSGESTLEASLTRAELDLPTVAGLNPRGFIERLVLSSVEGGFSGEGMLEVDLPFVGTVAAKATVVKNALKNARLTLDNVVHVPEGAPLMTAELHGVLDYDGERISAEGAIEGSLDLHLGDHTQKGDRRIVLRVDVDTNGKITPRVIVSGDVPLGEHFRITGANVHYDTDAKKWGGVIDFKAVAAEQEAELGLDLAAGGAEASLVDGRQDGGVTTSVTAGVSTHGGPFVEGTVAMGEGPVAASGSFRATAGDLIAGRGVDVEIAASNVPLMEGWQSHKDLFKEERTFTLLRWPVAGLYAEVGIDLGFDFALDPMTADMSGILKGFSLTTLRPPEGAELEATIWGGAQAQLTSTPKLGLGAYVGAPILLNAGGGLKVPIKGLASSDGEASAKIRYSGGAFSAAADIRKTLVFGISGAVVPYYHLSALGGTLERQGDLAPIADVPILPDKKILDFQVSFGTLGKPVKPTEGSGLQVGLLEMDSTATKAAEKDESPVQEVAAGGQVAPLTSDPGGSADGAFGGATLQKALQSFEGESWYPAATKMMEFFEWVAGVLSFSSEEVGKAIEWVNGYIDLTALDETFFANVTTDGSTSKMGLGTFLLSLVGKGGEKKPEEGGDTEEATVGTQLGELPVAPIRLHSAIVSLKKTSNGKARVVRMPFQNDLLLDELQDEITWGENGPEGALTGKLEMGAMGSLTNLRFEVAAGRANHQLTGVTFNAGTASSTLDVGGSPNATLFTTAKGVRKVALDSAGEVPMPEVIAGVELKGKPMQLGFAQETAGTWALTSANTSTLPFEGGRFSVQLTSYKMGPGGLSAKGSVFAEIDLLGRAGGTAEIANSKLKDAELGFESNRVALPQDGPIVEAGLKGKAAIKNGAFNGAEIAADASAFLQPGKATRLGAVTFKVEKVGAEWVPTFTLDVDPGLLTEAKLFEIVELLGLKLERGRDKTFGISGDLKVDIPGLGELQGGKVGFNGTKGLHGEATGMVATDALQGQVTAGYSSKLGPHVDAKKMRVAVPGLEPFEAGISYGKNELAFAVGPDVDVVKVTFGAYELRGGLQSLRYNTKSGAYVGVGVLRGELPVVGQVSGLLKAAGGKGLSIERAELRASRKDLAIPGAKPVIQGPFSGNLAYEKGKVTGGVTGTALKLNAPGLGEGATLSFAANYAEGGVSGSLELNDPGANEGYVKLKSLKAAIDDKGDFSGAATAGLDVAGVSGDLTGRLDKDGLAIEGTGISYESPRVKGTIARAGYHPTQGVYLEASASAELSPGLIGTGSIKYPGTGGGKKSVDADIGIENLELMKGGGRRERDLLNIPGVLFPLLALPPVPIVVYAELAAKAKLAYGFDPLVMNGKAAVQGLDLSTGRFKSASLAPTLTGGVSVTLQGGPSLGLVASLIHPWAAYVKGAADFQIGGTAALKPKLAGLLQFGEDGLSGGGALKMPLILSAQAMPSISVEVGMLNGYLAKKFPLSFGPFPLMKPKRIFELSLDFGSLGDKAGSLADQLPDGTALPEASTPDASQQTMDTTTTQPGPQLVSGDKAPVHGEPSAGDLAAAQGPFNLAGEMKALLIEKVQGVKSWAVEKWETVKAVLNGIKDLAVNTAKLAKAGAQKLIGTAAAVINAGALTTEAVVAWISRSYGGNVDAALKAIEFSDNIFGVRSLQALSEAGIPEAFQKLEELMLAEYEKRKSDDVSWETFRGAFYVTTFGAGLFADALLTSIYEGFTHSRAKRKEQDSAAMRMGAIREGVDKGLEELSKVKPGSREWIQGEAGIELARVMAIYGVDNVLKHLDVSGMRYSEDYEELGHERLSVGAAMQQNKSAILRALEAEGQVREVWKTGDPQHIKAIDDCLVRAYAMTTKPMFQRIANSFSGMVGVGWFSAVKEQFVAAHVLKRGDV